MIGSIATSLLAPLLFEGFHNTLESFDAPRPVALEAAHLSLAKKGFNPDTDIDLLIVVDFDQPSYKRRLVVYERGHCPVQQSLVSHGHGNADPTKLFATRFSNVPGSEMMSLGLFLVSRDRPSAKFGRSIEIQGLDGPLNDRAHSRKIVIHPAHYVSYGSIAENLVEELNPRLGQSRGCPALEKADFARLLERIRTTRAAGGYVFLYAHKDPPEPAPKVWSFNPVLDAINPLIDAGFVETDGERSQGFK